MIAAVNTTLYNGRSAANIKLENGEWIDPVLELLQIVYREKTELQSW